MTKVARDRARRKITRDSHEKSGSKKPQGRSQTSKRDMLGGWQPEADETGWQTLKGAKAEERRPACAWSMFGVRLHEDAAPDAAER
jgi:hypothetical protein